MSIKMTEYKIELTVKLEGLVQATSEEEAVDQLLSDAVTGHHYGEMFEDSIEEVGFEGFVCEKCIPSNAYRIKHKLNNVHDIYNLMSFHGDWDDMRNVENWSCDICEEEE